MAQEATMALPLPRLAVVVTCIEFSKENFFCTGVLGQNVPILMKTSGLGRHLDCCFMCDSVF